MKTLLVQVFKDRKKQWRWRARAGNRQIVATCGEGYKRRRDCMVMVRKLFLEGPRPRITIDVGGVVQ